MWMQNYCSMLIAGGGNVGCAKYAGLGGKGGNICVVTKEDQISK
jgi:siroheme synthase (precorrin-2 oxidase/ferrochelatase)